MQDINKELSGPSQIKELLLLVKEDVHSAFGAVLGSEMLQDKT